MAKINYNKNTQSPSMSFWGIGPIFGFLSIIISGATVFFTFHFPDIFKFSSYFLLCLISGIIIIILGLCLWIGGALKIDSYIKENILATKGVYGIVRNPVYSGILFVMTGAFLSLQSWLLLATLPINYMLLKLLLQKEDKVLTQAFDEKYISYKNEVNSVIPKFSSFYNAFLYPEKTRKISDNLYAIKDKNVNIFIYKTKKSYICFDTGYGSSSIPDKLNSLNIKPEQIKYVFLTHSDHDHTKGSKFFKEAILYLGENEEALIIGKSKRLKPFYSNPLIKRQIKFLKNNEVVKIDDTIIQTIFTNGHTLGHVAYLINSEILITGDSVIIQNGQIKPFYQIFNMNHKQARLSTKKIKDICDNKTVCSAHTGVLTINN